METHLLHARPIRVSYDSASKPFAYGRFSAKPETERSTRFPIRTALWVALLAIAAAFMVSPFSPIPNAWYAAPVLVFGFPVAFIVNEYHRAKRG
jgi:hypothetical protein